MATAPKGVDRRVERTRQMLRQAFLQIAREKDLASVSVQDIVERANVSRGTFYAHYADKYALVETIVREEFRRALSILPPTSEWTRDTFRQLIQIVLDYYQAISQTHHRSRDIAPYLDQAIHEELNTLIVIWLKQKQSPLIYAHISLEMLAQAISWAIFGAAAQWSQGQQTVTSEQAAEDISRLIFDGAASLIPEI
jgi:AcrR family transcriptional regulator